MLAKQKSPQIRNCVNNSASQQNDFVVGCIVRLYNKYKYKKNLPAGCTWTQFMIHIDQIIHQGFENVPDRESLPSIKVSQIYQY